MLPRLSEIIGQDDAVGQLETLARAERLPHAMLLVGPDGTGKRTFALSLVAAMLCKTRQRNPDGPFEPCGRCDGCEKVRLGSHADLQHLLTEERSIKIAVIRDIERGLRLRPVEGGPKVLLVEDAHKMTIEAQNALLKTLEEPPGHAYLMLTTDRLGAILPTVVSRCQRVDFRPLSADRVEARVVEAFGVDPSEARLLAALAGGSLGRVLSLEPEALFERRDDVAALDRTLSPGRPQTALLALEAASQLGTDRSALSDALELLLIWLRDQSQVGANGPEADIANADRRADVIRLADERGLRGTLARSRLVLEAKRQLDLPFNLNAQMIAEQLCLALAGHGTMPPVE